MNKVILSLFIVLVTALPLVILLYFRLHKIAIAKTAFRHLILHIIILAFVLDLIWEMLQVSLYTTTPLPANHMTLCIITSVGDVIKVLILYLGFGMIYKDPFWIKDRGTLIMMMVGAAVAIVSEVCHLATGNWAYTEAMPLLPFVKVGLLPVLQFTILPVLAYYLSAFYLKLFA